MEQPTHGHSLSHIFSLTKGFEPSVTARKNCAELRQAGCPYLRWAWLTAMWGLFLYLRIRNVRYKHWRRTAGPQWTQEENEKSSDRPGGQKVDRRRTTKRDHISSRTHTRAPHRPDKKAWELWKDIEWRMSGNAPKAILFSTTIFTPTANTTLR